MKVLRLCLLLPALFAAACSGRPPPDTASASSPYAAVARGRIDVEGGLLALAAPRDGILTSVAVHEGDRVRRGQVLAALDPAPARLQLQGARAAMDQAVAQRELLDSRLAAAKLQAQRLRAAADAGAGAGQSADTATAEVRALEAERAADAAAVTMAAQKRDEAAYELAQRTLRAPLDAEVVRVAAQPGAAVSPASGTLFTLLPLTPPIVRAELNESYLDAVAAGMPASVVSDGGGPDREWSAHVLRIGPVIGPSSLQDDPGQRAEQRTASCVLAFDRPPAGVRIGQRVLVRFAHPPGAPAAARAVEVPR